MYDELGRELGWAGGLVVLEAEQCYLQVLNCER